MSALVASLIAACNAFAAWVKWQQSIELDKLEDEIDRLAAIGDPASKLRIERLHARYLRKQNKCERII
jgi:hypothetical protein